VLNRPPEHFSIVSEVNTRQSQIERDREDEMIVDGIEDEEKWVAEGIASVQHNAFFMHRALVKFSPPIFQFPNSDQIQHFSMLISLSISIEFPGFRQFERSSQVLRSNAIGAPNLQTLPSQVF